jgi:creatinine amidohydrolase
MLVCAYGGSAEPVSNAVSKLRAEGRDVRAFIPDWGGDAHAGLTETSLMLAVAPAMVPTERAQAGNPQLFRQLIGAPRSHGVAGVSPNGVLGDPAGAPAAHGEAILERAVQSPLAQLQG